MKRRTLIKSTLAGGALVGLGGSLAWLSVDASHEPLTIAAALAKLDHLTVTTQTTGQWQLAEILTHCAQSVEYSLTGYPEHKSAFFKQTIGPLAFAAFAAKGKMKHSLSEAIPGAPALNSKDVLTALARLKQSLQDFKQHQGPLAPHFAYGELNKAEYEMAHVMHIYNHLQEVAYASSSV